MNEEKIKDLLDYLESLGFKNHEFKEKIRIASINSNLPFDLEHSVNFGEELIKFRLEFWWDHQFNAFKLVRYRAAYRSSPTTEDVVKEYGPLAKGIYHVNSVYHDISGRMDDLYERFQPMDLESFTDIELYWELQQHLSHNPENFEIKCFRNNPEGFIEYIIPINKTNGNYELTTYKATFTPYPPIQHGVYNDIDTLALEELMTKIEWHNDKELFIFHQDAEPEFTPKVGEVQEQIHRLSLDMIGADIADQLGLKYWRDVTFLGDNLQQSAWDYEQTLPTRNQNFPPNLKIKCAFNALCGRAVFQNKAHRLLEDNPAWKRFDFSFIGPNGSYVCEVVPGFDKDQLKEELKNLPLQADQFDRIINGLLLGDRVKMTLPNGQKLYLEANPEQKIVNIFSENMRPVMVNFHFDPDWRPLQNRQLEPEELKRKPPKHRIQPEAIQRKNTQRKHR